MMATNVLSWKQAVQSGLKPGLYPYKLSAVPLGEVAAVLDYKVWAKKILGIGCYFTQIATGRKFQVTVYCKFQSGLYTINGSEIDFASCPIGRVYYLTIVEHRAGRPNIEKVILP